jgi:tetratricopeptide (TPR) repeat protein
MINVIRPICIIGLLISCTTSKPPITTPEANTRVKDERVTEMLLGHCTRTALLESPYKEWFVKNYNDYAVDSSAANELARLLAGKTIVTFMGTWCGDSKREVPRLLKILDYCHFRNENLNLVMVSYRDGAYKQSPQHEERGKNIFRVPTILLYAGNKELGRIIEFPKQSLEKDMVSILKNEQYKPNYAGGYDFFQKMNSRSMKKLQADSTQLSASLRSSLRNSFELNSIGNVLFDQGQKEKSLFVFNLNKDLYPGAANVWNGFAKINISLNRYDEARLALARALALDSTNEETKRLTALMGH